MSSRASVKTPVTPSYTTSQQLITPPSQAYYLNLTYLRNSRLCLDWADMAFNPIKGHPMTGSFDLLPCSTKSVSLQTHQHQSRDTA